MIFTVPLRFIPVNSLASAAFKHLDLLRERACPIVEADRKLLRDFLKQQSSLCAVSTEGGNPHHSLDCSAETPTFFLSACGSLFDTSAVPGRFFEMPDHFRIGHGREHGNVRRRPESNRPGV